MDGGTSRSAGDTWARVTDVRPEVASENGVIVKLDSTVRAWLRESPSRRVAGIDVGVITSVLMHGSGLTLNAAGMVLCPFVHFSFNPSHCLSE